MTIVEEQDAQQVSAGIKAYFTEQKGRALLDEINIKDTLGLGTFGRVRLMEAPKLRDVLEKQEKSHAQSCFFALKIMKKSEILRLKQTEHVLSERSILRAIQHPFIVFAYHGFQDERNVYMVLDYVAGGMLISHLRKEGKFAPDNTRFYAAQIVMALQYLHSMGIVYRDLRPENLILDTTGYLKMVDFGYAKTLKTDSLTWTLVGTPEYLAPEIIQSKGHNKAVDWWALGILVYEMLAGYPPYYDENPFGIYQKILSGKLEFPRHFDTHSRDLIRRLLTADRLKRIGSLKNGAEDIKKHKWYRGLNWAALYNKQMESYIDPKTCGHDDTSNFDKYFDSVEESGPLINPNKDSELFGAFDDEIP